MNVKIITLFTLILGVGIFILSTEYQEGQHWKDDSNGSSGEKFSIIAVPDLQKIVDTTYGNKYYPQRVQAMARWITSMKGPMNIKYVIQQGDLVEHPNSNEEWNRVFYFFDLLKTAKIPFAIAPGNKELSSTDCDVPHNRHFNGFKAFCEKVDYSNLDGFSASIDSNFLTTIHEFNVNGQLFLIANFPYCPTRSELDWIGSRIDSYPNPWVILNTHAFLVNKHIYLVGQDDAPNMEVDDVFSVTIIGGKDEPIHENLKRVNDKFKNDPRVFLLMSGHTVMGFRNWKTSGLFPAFNGDGIDWSNKESGAGWVNVFEFNPEDSSCRITAFNPFLGRIDSFPIGDGRRAPYLEFKTPF